VSPAYHSGPMSQRQQRLKPLRVVLTGFAMGAADLVPGVSGGTVALVGGIYDRLLSAISSINRASIAALFTGRWRVVRSEVDFGFIVPLAIGLLAAIVSLAEPLGRLLESEDGRVLLFSFFFGLVVGSVIAVGRNIHWVPRSTMLAAGAAIGAFFVVQLAPVTGPSGLIALFAAGFVAACAMVLPGISGSFILLIIGQYERILGAVRGRDLVVVGTVAAGVVVGVLTFARLLQFLLVRYRNGTLAVLSGFMAGSLWKIWPWRVCLEEQVIADESRCMVESLQAPEAIAAPLALALAGLMLVIAFSLWERRQPRSEVTLAGSDGSA